MHPLSIRQEGGDRLKRTRETHLVFGNLKRGDSLVWPSSKTHNAPLLVHQSRIEKAVHNHHTFLMKDSNACFAEEILVYQGGRRCPCVDCAWLDGAPVYQRGRAAAEPDPPRQVGRVQVLRDSQMGQGTDANEDGRSLCPGMPDSASHAPEIPPAAPESPCKCPPHGVLSLQQVYQDGSCCSRDIGLRVDPRMVDVTVREDSGLEVDAHPCYSGDADGLRLEHCGVADAET
ncbi:hypothetical protein S40288_10757 [Stachybotrys chartarum IBT 40288]|nr:hypothetical protein S40288_10757 [Stachybotrys chartarum IBT 40288]